MSHSHEVDACLPPWEVVRHESPQGWDAILLGNGASRAVWDRFGYPSLFELASSDQIHHPLDCKDKELFESLKTKNFETILEALSISHKVARALGEDSATQASLERYESIRRALIESIDAIHVKRDAVSEETLRTIAGELQNFRYVFSTNYDLLVYWAMQAAKFQGFKDYFWSHGPYGFQCFDVKDTLVWSKATRVLYLHGALHLHRLQTGHTVKGATTNLELLERWLDVPIQDDTRLPLFISEGTSDEKLAAILQSDYLSFAYRRFSNQRGPIVVFGHRLSTDRHLINAMNGWTTKTAAISILPKKPDDVMRRKHDLHKWLPEFNLYFFDAMSHPLGNPSLKTRDH